MPAHDWTRVPAGIYHSFHNTWISELSRAFNNGGLPEGYYALAEQHAGDYAPDVLALERRDQAPRSDDEGESREGGVALAEAPPRLSIALSVDDNTFYAKRRRTLAIRHVSGDRVVALIEIASPGNKDRLASVRAFVEKAEANTRAGHHLVIVDPFPPRAADPDGLCSAASAEILGTSFALPGGRPISVAAFRCAGANLDCFAETLAVGDRWPDVPLFLDADHYVDAQLESTSAAAFSGLPRHLRDEIAAPPTA